MELTVEGIQRLRLVLEPRPKRCVDGALIHCQYVVAIHEGKGTEEGVDVAFGAAVAGPAKVFPFVHGTELVFKFLNVLKIFLLQKALFPIFTLVDDLRSHLIQELEPNSYLGVFGLLQQASPCCLLHVPLVHGVLIPSIGFSVMAVFDYKVT